MPPCPLCSNPQATTTGDFDRAVERVDCVICGRFRVSEQVKLLRLSDARLKDKMFLLSAAARQCNENDEVLELQKGNIDSLLQAVRAPSTLPEALDSALLMIHRRTTRLTEDVPISLSTDYPLIACRDKDEFASILSELKTLGLIELQMSGACRLTVDGWNRVASLATSLTNPSRAFVAMWFDAEMDGAWSQGFEPGLRDARYDPVRVDRIEHNEKICDRVLAEIRRSGLLVADFTGGRGSVYFEAGFAMGLGLPVVWTCRADCVDNLQFDTRQYNHIVWSDPNDLRCRLRDRVIATVTRLQRP